MEAVVVQLPKTHFQQALILVMQRAAMVVIIKVVLKDKVQLNMVQVIKVVVEMVVKLNQAAHKEDKVVLVMLVSL